MGVTFASFNMSGNTPVSKERLNILAKCWGILLLRSLIVNVRTLFGLADLQLLSEEMILDIPSPAVGAFMNDSNLLAGRKSSIDLLENFIFAWTDWATPVKKLWKEFTILAFCVWWIGHRELLI